MTIPQPPEHPQPQTHPQAPPQEPVMNYQMNSNQYSRNANSLAGSLITLTIYQILQTLFFILIFIVILSVSFARDEDINVLTMPIFFRIILAIIMIAILISFVMSTIFIFMKKKIGIVLSYACVALQVFFIVFAVIARIIFIESNIDDIADDDPYHIGAIFTIVFVSAIFWALHLLLLMLPVSKRNIKESFK